MQRFFDRLDSGMYDTQALAIIGVLLVATFMWHYIEKRRNEKAFFAARDAAHESFMKLGPEDITTQLRVMEALNAWRVWQHRPVPSTAEIGDYPSPAEWEVLPLLGAYPERPEKYVH